MDDTETSTQPAQSKKWECGDPYQYPIPEAGDHWENVLNPLMDSDRAQCESWKDEVQNLLVFAGLFSGVLSAFIIQSTQSLQPNPDDVIVALLAHIATRLDNPLNETAPVSQPIGDLLSPGSPAPSSIRINVFWFISLVLSLTTVLVGIVSLQWLREHQQYPKSLSSKQVFALFNMRAEGLEAWYVPQVFSALPLLLQLALVLFLVGLVDFLIPFGVQVAIPVILTIALPLAFLVWTTVVPAFQAFLFFIPFPKHGSQTPQQCPYKSPQSRIIRYLLTISRPAFLFLARSTMALHSVATIPPWRLMQLIKHGETNSEDEDSPIIHEEHKWVLRQIFSTWNKKTWLSFDDDWLVLRDAYASSISNSHWTVYYLQNSIDVGPLYDLARGLSSVTIEDGNPTIQFSGYHCARDLATSIIGENSRMSESTLRPDHNQYLRKLLGSAVLNQQFPTFSGLLEKAELGFLEDENAFIFLSQYRKPLPVVLQHFAELHIRILNYMVAHPETTQIDIEESLPDRPRYPIDRWEVTYRKGAWSTAEYDAAFDAQISSQFFFALEALFASVANVDIDLATFAHGHKLREIFSYASLRQSQDTIPSTLDFLSANIRSYTNGNFGERTDFVFYASAAYARSLMIPDPFMFLYGTEGWHTNPLVVPFVPILQQYLEQRGTPDATLGERLGIPVPSDPWWGFLNHPLEENERRSQEELKIIVPPSKPPVEKNLVTGKEEKPSPDTSHDAAS